MSARLGLVYLCVAVTLLTAVFAAPVLRAPHERIFGTETVGRHHDPYTVMQQFGGAPVQPPYLQPATDWVGRAIARVTSPVAAFNVLTLLTFPLTALFTYLLAYEITRSVPASVMAGLLCAFAPFHVAHSAYHPHVAQVHWIPLYFFALWRCLHGINRARALALGASLCLVVLSNYYSALIVLTMTIAAVPLFWLASSTDGGGRDWRDLAWTSALMLAFCAAALGIAREIVPNVFDQRAAFAVDRDELFLFSARWWAYLVPPVEHSVLGSWSRELLSSSGVAPALVEQQLYLGYGVLTLAAAALWAWLRARDRRELRVVPFLAAVAAIALVCSLSPEGEILGIRFVRPSALTYLVAPMFRAYARFGVVVHLMIAIVAAMGMSSLWQRRASLWQAGMARGAAVALIGLTAFEYAPLPWRWRDVLPTSAHRWLVRQGVGLRVFDCSNPSLSEQATPWLAGYQLAYLHEALPDCGEPDLAAKLRATGYTHLLVRAGRREFQWLVRRPQEGLRRSYLAGDGAVFDVIAAPPIAYVASLKGLYPREYNRAWTWRWTSRSATLQIENLSAASYARTLDVELAAFGIQRHVVVSLNGDPVTDFVVGSDRALYPIGPLLLRPGTNELTLASVEPPLVAGTLERNNDSRPLALALGRWR